MGEADNETIGARLRRLRVERGLSQREIASRGVSNAYISRIEAGTRVPSVKAIRELARKLGVTPDFLERGVDANPREEGELHLLRAELALRLDGDAEAAERLLRPVLEQAEREGDERTAIRAQLLLGLAACGRSAHEQALEYLSPPISSGRLDPVASPELYIAAARCLDALDRHDEAVTFLQDALDVVSRLAGPRSLLTVSFSSELAELLERAGSDEQATRLLARALERSEQPRDPMERARLIRKQARRAAEAHDPRGELELLRRAIALLEAGEGAHGLAHAHLLYARILTDAGRANEALENVELAETLLTGDETASESFRIQRVKARAALRSGRPQEAVELARSALALSTVEDPLERGSAHWTLAEGLAALGQTAAAEAEVGKALSMLRSADPRMASKLLRWWAKILRLSGRTDEAFAALEEALLLG
jgi:transcriptional regulator with XRE-family HTH domain